MSDGVLVLGTSGQVGRALTDPEGAGRALALLGPVTAAGRAEADLAQPESLRALVRRLRPRVIVNAAAYTAVDRAESEPVLAQAVNVTAPGVLAEEAARLGACLLHYSTDYVFDGTGTRPWREDDRTAPLSVYGRTKRDGEVAVRRAPRHLILRTSWVVSPWGTNFVRTILRLAAERPALRVVDDQVGAPTSAALVAELTARLLAAMRDTPAEDPRWGTYHAAPTGETSWHGLARHVVAHAADAGVPLACASDAIVAIPTAEYPTPARRPLNSRLDTSRLRAAFGPELPDWRPGVDAAVDALLPTLVR